MPARSHPAIRPMIDRAKWPFWSIMLYSFEWEPRWWERWLVALGAPLALEPGEAERRFGDDFEIERFAETVTGSALIPATATYLMARKSS